MITGSSQKPYPVTCSVRQCFLGPPYQHARVGDDKIPLYNLSLKVPNWNHCSGQPSTIPVYARPNAQDACDGPIPCPDGITCGSDTYIEPCGGWIGVTDLDYTLVTGQLNTAPTQSSGSGYTRGTPPFDFQNMKVCQKRGFKSVQAKRSWNGTFGLTDESDGGCPDTWLDCGGGDIDSYESYKSTPPQEKYGTISYDFTYTITGYDEPVGSHHPTQVNALYDGSGSGSVTVDPNTGILTSSLTASELIQGPGLGGSLFTVSDVTDGVDSISGDSGFTTDGDLIFISGYTCRGLPPIPLGAGTHSDWQTFIDSFNAVSGSSLPAITSSPDSYSQSSTYSVPGYPGTHSFAISVDITRTNTEITWDFSWDETIDAEPEPSGTFENTRITYAFSGSITLGNPNIASTIVADAESLLGQWPLNDDLLYPWRTDSKPQIAPLVSRNELGATSPMAVFPPFTTNDMTSPIDDADGNAPFSSGWTPTYDQIGWFDDRAYSYRYPTGMNSGNSAAVGLVQMIDGSVLGKPNPAGYADYFMWGFQNWIACCDRSGDTPLISWFTDSSGILVSVFNGEAVVQLPLNATQWTNNYQSIDKIPGAFLAYEDFSPIGSTDADCPNNGGAPDGGYLWAQKYAEIKEDYQAQNYARPAGADKFVYDETQVFCAANLSGSGAGSTWTITNYLDETPGDGTDFSGTWGGPVVSGFYSVSSYASGTLTLGAKVYDVPDDWLSASGDDGFCFGKLRFPSAPSLLGRAGIKAADGSGKIFTFNNGQTKFGMAVAGTESVDFYDATMTLIAAAVTVKSFKRWQAGFAYSAGDVITDGTNGQICTTGGTSSGSAPTWATTIGDTTTDGGSLVWTVLILGITADSAFLSPTAYLNAVWVVIAGVNYEFNSNYPRGNCVALTWTYDARTSDNFLGHATSEYQRLTGVFDCSGIQISRPTPNHGFAAFSQTQICLPFSHCAPRVVCFSPNAEVFPNGVTIPFPETFLMDERYGSKWVGFVQVTMHDLYWQSPHTPCSAVSLSIVADPGDTVGGTDIIWTMDDGTCKPDSFDEDTGRQTMYYPHVPLVEAEITLPGYGFGTPQTDTPTLPAGFSLPWLSPVTDTTGDVAFPPAPGAFNDEGIPSPVTSAYGIRATIEQSVATGSDCRFLGAYEDWFIE